MTSEWLWTGQFLYKSMPGQPAGAMCERDKIVLERLNNASPGWMLSCPWRAHCGKVSSGKRTFSDEGQSETATSTEQLLFLQLFLPGDSLKPELYEFITTMLLCSNFFKLLLRLHDISAAGSNKAENLMEYWIHTNFKLASKPFSESVSLNVSIIYFNIILILRFIISYNNVIN